MKKITCIIISLLLVLCAISPVYCEAQNINLENLSSLSDDDLLNYDNLLQAEIAKRGLLVHLTDGEYVVGKDIPAGEFIIKYYNFGEPVYDCTMYIYVFPSDKKGEKAILSERLFRASQYKISLEEGQLLKIQGSHTQSVTFIEKAPSLFEQLSN